MTPTASDAAATYRPEIDGLRAIAVLLVLVFHFEVLDLGHAGFLGVDVFFVISGYLITLLIVREMDQQSFRLSTFYVRRVRRLAPALLVVLLLTVAFGAKVLFAEQFVELLRQATLSQLYLVNIYFWRSINYFGLIAQDVHLLHLWSLCVEEHFYLVYPLALLLVHRHLRRHLWWVVGAAMLASFALNLFLVASKPEATFYLLPTRAWELLAGGLLAGVLQGRTLAPSTRDGLLATGILLLVAALALYQRDTRFPGAFAALPVAAAACVLASIGATPTRLSPLLSNRVMRYVGRISYPLYLVHWPVHVFGRQVLSDAYTPDARWTLLWLSIALAALIYHLVEQPIRRGALLRSDRRLLASYLTGVAVVATGFLLVRAADGLPGRFPDPVQRMASHANDKSPALDQCQYQGAPLEVDSPPCRIGAADAPLTWLVYGDSHALAAHAVFDTWLRRHGRAGVLFYRNSCPPNLGLHAFGDRGLCLRFNEHMLDLLQRHSSIDHVFLVSTWLQAWHGRLSPVEYQLLTRQDSIRAFDDAFGSLLARLHASGKRVHIWEPVPGARDHVPLATARSMLYGRPVDLSLPREEYDQVYAYFFAMLQKYRGSFEATFSPAAAICDGSKCAAMIDGVPAYADNSHITRSPAAFWVDAMERAGLMP